MEVDQFSDIETTSGDDVNDDEITTTSETKAKFQKERYEKLGFVPQKEIYCNKYLPYADQLDDESQLMLTQLKEALAKAVAFREMTPAVGIATSRLLV